MATEKEANKARAEHADYLASLGAHSLGVDEIGRKGSKKFAVFAFLLKENKKIPKELIIQSGKKKVSVPLIIQVAEKYKAE